ncbi:hypothetical protein IMZ31_24290 (plasmid) [Pontibacillus sp. ALD_SL1]|uniref:hypothetical protein n=1 Tax=Pontibacillus sp. ALD_SL1 TaxID=2777185 RepID=UPI001A9578D9|nr:hypothetical protein [Pontibacillus sp. ALD_SL1]QST02573.1 hypothetical protein IMZ31_24290 [Pontibacillus sp. ALD_SL1]
MIIIKDVELSNLNAELDFAQELGIQIDLFEGYPFYNCRKFATTLKSSLIMKEEF